jgi:uncharacterized peroxidase-related enzyme
MSRIKLRRREDLPELEPHFKTVEARMGFIPNSQLAMAHRPKLLDAFLAMGRAANDPDASTSPQLRNLVAYIASYAAGCQYCQAHTASNASRSRVEDRKIAAIWEYETSPLFSDAERAALRFAQCAASVPNGATDAEFAEMRKYYSEAEIVEILYVVCYFGFLNRWNDTCATRLEEDPARFAAATLGGSGWQAGKHDGAVEYKDQDNR